MRAMAHTMIRKACKFIKTMSADYLCFHQNEFIFSTTALHSSRSSFILPRLLAEHAERPTLNHRRYISLSPQMIQLLKSWTLALMLQLFVDCNSRLSFQSADSCALFALSIFVDLCTSLKTYHFVTLLRCVQKVLQDVVPRNHDLLATQRSGAYVEWPSLNPTLQNTN